MKSSLLFASCAALGFCSSAAWSQTAEQDAAAFGARPAVLDISLAPSGNKIAYIAPVEGSSEAVMVADMKTGAVKPILVMWQKDGELDSCRWAAEAYLVCGASFVRDEAGMLLGFSRTFSINAETGESKLMSERASADSLGLLQNGGTVMAVDLANQPSKIMMTRQWVPERTTGTRMNSDREGLGVDLVDLRTGQHTALEQPDREAERYVTDEHGTIRMKVRHLLTGGGQMTGERDFLYRAPGSDRWIKLSHTETVGDRITGFYPVAIDSATNSAIGFSQQGGFDAVYRLALQEQSEPQLLLGRPDVDVDDILRFGRNSRVVGASFATEKRQVVYFDKELDKLAEQLHQALPNKPLINFVDASADEQKLLLIASSDTDPGMVYLYDKATHKLEEVLPMREGMNGRAMGQMKPVSFPAADGTAIPAYLTLPPGTQGKNLPAIVLPHGGPSARDEWGFDWLVQYFVARGYAVLQPNYRGSAGYGSAWFGRNGFKAWRTAIGDVDDAGRWLVSQGIADPGELAIVGWSYGGYAALQSQVLDPQLYKAVVAIAPVTDLDLLRSEAERFTNAALVRKFVGEGPHIEQGSPARNAGSFAAPVLMFHGDKDQNVDIEQSRIMAKRLRDAGKQVQLFEYPGLAHSLDDSAVRAQMLVKIDAFLKQSLKR
jgi:dipeptidyl aminopeptidase/acylaminoacyl peptidase